MAVVVPSPASVTGLAGHFVDQFRTHVLVRIFQFDFFADGHTVFGDDGIAEAFVDDHIATGRAHRDSDSFRQCVDAALQLQPGLIVKQKLLCHVLMLLRNGFQCSSVQFSVFRLNAS